MTRRRLLTEAQARQVRAEVAIGRENTPKKICARWGISRHALRAYVQQTHSVERPRYSTEELARELGYE